jgi:hypothetical protein
LPEERKDVSAALKFERHSAGGRVKAAPAEGIQVCGEVKFDGRAGAMTVSLEDVAGAALFKQEPAPQRL